MKKRKLMALVLAMTAVLSSSFMVHAADTNTTQKAGSISSEVTTSTDASTGSTTSAFLVAVPAKVTLTRDASDPTLFSGTYNVGVRGVLASGKKVSVTPAATFDMTGKSSSTKVTANVTQAVTKWVDADATAGSGEAVIGFKTYTEKPGSISVYIQKADTYTGTLGFTVALN